MFLLELASIISVFFFGALSVFLSVKEEKTKKELTSEQKKQKQRLYHIEILKQIQDRIGYSLDIERVIDVITGSLQDLFPYTSASSLAIKEDKIIFKTYLKETASPNFVAEVKKSMLASLSAILNKEIKSSDNDFITGNPLDPNNLSLPQSFFHIPLIVNERVKGLITVASTKSAIYQESDMTILYQITNSASDTLGKLENVLNTEQEKLIAMIKSLADGVFMVDSESRLVVINNAAKQIINVVSDNPTLIDILSLLPPEIELAGLIKNAIAQNKYTEKKNISFGERILNILIIPVTASNKVLGASVVLHDITLEENLAQAKEDFTNIIVHELRAPLVAIKGASQLIERQNNLTNIEIIKLSALVSEQSEKLLTEISSILDAAKIESGRFIIQKEPADLNSLIQNQINLFAPESVRRGIKITAQTESLPIIFLDKTKITNCLNNLISNSIRFGSIKS